MTSYVRSERAALCDLLDRLGPDAPTLCEGWATRDLAAHLVVRERGVLAAAGIAVKSLRGHNRRVQDELAAKPYGELVGMLRAGPPRWWLMGWSPVEETLSTIEYSVHHEDVRRAQPHWSPRQLPAEQQDDLWGRLGRTAQLTMRRVPVGVVLARPTGQTHQAREGSPAATVTGEPLELLLYALGRQDHAVVTLGGDEGAVAALTRARLKA
jgi:uncharacterized protein (TIGR03085 family)